MINKIYDFSNIDEAQKIWSDVVNNEAEYRRKYTAVKLLTLPDVPIDADYSHLPSVEEIINNKFPSAGLPCRVKVRQLYASKIYNRTIPEVEKGDSTCRANLLSKNCDGNIKGFSASDANFLVGFIRTASDGSYIIVQCQGNHRITKLLMAMKLTTDPDLEISIVLHKHSEERINNGSYINVESDHHYTDSTRRRNTNEEQKTRAGYYAGEPTIVAGIEFLARNGFEYAGLVEENYPNAPRPLVTLSNASGFMRGMNAGYYNQYKNINIECAMTSIRKIDKTICPTPVIGQSVIQTMAILYKYMCEFGINDDFVNPIFKRNEIDEYLLLHFKSKTKIDVEEDMLAPITNQKQYNLQSVGIKINKDVYLNTIHHFFPGVIYYHMRKNDKSKGFTSTCKAMKMLLDKVNVLNKKIGADIVNRKLDL